MPYKRIDLAIEACKRTNRRLIIIGDGPDRARLEKLGDERIEFLGRQPDQIVNRSEEHTSELQSRSDLVCRLLLEKKKNNQMSAAAADDIAHSALARTFLTGLLF